MYTSAEFSRITSWSITELQKYQEANIITIENGYYTQRAYQRAMRLHLLVAFHREQRLDLLLEDLSDDALCLQLRKELDEEGRNLLSETELMKAMEMYLTSTKDAARMQLAYQIKEEDIAEETAACFSYLGKHQDIHKQAAILKGLGYKQAEPFALCHDVEYKEQQHYTIGIPIKKALDNKDNRITIEQFPIKKVLSLFHIGSHDMLPIAYKALYDYAKAKGYSYELPVKEIYIKKEGTFWKGNPKKYVTKVQLTIHLPIKE